MPKICLNQLNPQNPPHICWAHPCEHLYFISKNLAEIVAWVCVTNAIDDNLLCFALQILLLMTADIT